MSEYKYSIGIFTLLFVIAGTLMYTEYNKIYNTQHIKEDFDGSLSFSRKPIN